MTKFFFPLDSSVCFMAENSWVSVSVLESEFYLLWNIPERRARLVDLIFPFIWNFNKIKSDSVSLSAKSSVCCSHCVIS